LNFYKRIGDSNFVDAVTRETVTAAQRCIKDGLEKDR
jgi:hypothetical protein